jgi:hypothetical protein
MTTKAQVTSGAPLPARSREAGGRRWGADARRFARNNPAVVLVGAFALGVLLARVARHA